MKKTLVDIFGKDSSELLKKRIWLFDMDGTIYNEEKLFDGSLSLLTNIVKNNGMFVFITNNSSVSLNDYVKKVNKMGISASRDNFFTSVQAIVLLLKEKYPNKKVYCQGTESMFKELEDSGIRVTNGIDDDIEVVVVGFDTELTSEKIRKTCLLLNRGLPFLATNCDLRCPVSFGYVPDCGSICQMITNATGKEPLFVGKPEPIMVEYVIKKFGLKKEDAVLVGDRLYTDIATGVNAGITSVCVLTGEASIGDIKTSPINPTYVFASVKDIVF